MPGRITSVGYEALDAATLAEQLAGEGVTVLVDVRLNAVSRRPGFSKRALAATLATAGIEYVHEPTLGNPRDNREAFHRGDGAAGRARMREILAEQGRDALERLVARAQASHVAVLCVERDPTRCHRSAITEMIAERDPAIDVRVPASWPPTT